MDVNKLTHYHYLETYVSFKEKNQALCSVFNISKMFMSNPCDSIRSDACPLTRLDLSATEMERDLQVFNPRPGLTVNMPNPINNNSN